MNVQCSIIELTNEVSRVDDNDFTQGCFPGGHTSGDHRTRRSAPSVGNILILPVSTDQPSGKSTGCSSGKFPVERSHVTADFH